MASKPSKIQNRLAGKAPGVRRSVFANPHVIMSAKVRAEEAYYGDKPGENNKKVIFMGRAAASDYRYKPEDVVISICDCTAKNPEFSAYPPKDVLNLKFQDHVTTHEATQYGWHWMMAEDGEKIAEFVQKHTDTDTIIVHCNYGQSRSKAIAITIAEYTGRKLLHANDFGHITHYLNKDTDLGNHRCGDIVRMGFECLEEEIKK